MRYGIALPQYRIDVAAGTALWQTLLATARQAEMLGVDAVWRSDHPFAVGPDGSISGALEPLTSIAALVGATRRIELGTLVLAGTMRAPSILASVAKTLASDRVTLGIGAGWFEPEHRAFGVPLPRFRGRLARLEENLQAVRSLGDARPRILVGGAGPGTMELAARYADAWNVAWDVPADGFRNLTRRLDELCDGAARDPRTLQRSVGLTVLVARDDHAADAAVERLRGRASFLVGVERSALSDAIIAGAPATCAERIASYGADEVIVAPLLRDDPSMLELLATEVAPLLRREGRG
jgi:alkanesulfonate monooxygenase SsuD/methylene tetrahydromethanopterin reductase-like flavin-dependent oxidoreductase (luciferase family)